MQLPMISNAGKSFILGCIQPLEVVVSALHE